MIILKSKTGLEFEDWLYSKEISILQALICLIKPLIDLTTFPHLEHIYNLDSIAMIINSRYL